MNARGPFTTFLFGLYLVAAAHASDAAPSITLDSTAYQPSSGVAIEQQDSDVLVTWNISDRARARLKFNLLPDGPLISACSLADDRHPDWRELASSIDPVVLLRTGKRDLELRKGWTIFFDRMQEKPHQLHLATFRREWARATSQQRRATLAIGEVRAGPFHGHMRWTFYAGLPIVLQEAVFTTQENAVAYLYDMGLVFHQTLPQVLTWRPAAENTNSEQLAEQPVNGVNSAQHLAVLGRSIAAQFDHGSLCVFPLPHRYFYPLDFSDNLKNIWTGAGYAEQNLPFGIGIRHDPRGDNRFVPWFNAPPGSQQAMGMFLSVSTGDGKEAMRQTAHWTREDRFDPLVGHKVFSSHYHVEHTEEILQAQSSQDTNSDVPGRLPSGDTYRIPAHLEQPGFVKTFRRMGVDIVHLAEFHFGRTPGMDQEQRLRYLQHLHAECKRLSNDDFLLIPGEEPNVHLGGHWISLFPGPVYWVLNRPEGTPLVSEDPRLGRIYHVGNEAEVLRLLNLEQGLAWTAHPRIKGSTGYPDRYRNRPFFQSERFLGAAWKAMPADLSEARLGSRVLDLMDDMSNWGAAKFVLGEVDVFKIEPDHDLYGHMNVNYLRLDDLPRFEQGWPAILSALRDGRFFVTTGEILIKHFTVGDREAGSSASCAPGESMEVRLELDWTFPLERAELVSGDGQQTYRHLLDLSDTSAYGSHAWTLELDLSQRRWVRLEVWDIATNGAFSQPVWITSP